MPQVLINFDINEEKVAENAAKEAGRRICEEMFGNEYDRWNREGKIRAYVKSVVRELLEPQKEEFVNEAIREVVENLHRTKAVKEKLSEVLCESK